MTNQVPVWALIQAARARSHRALRLARAFSDRGLRAVYVREALHHRANATLLRALNASA